MPNILVRDGLVHYEDEQYKCAVGPNGIGVDIKEGDGKTPAGEFPLRRVFYRSDRIGNIQTALPLVAISEDDIWCDDVNDVTNYNKQIKGPYAGSHEKLWREDEIYDIVLEIGYNDNPPVPGKGSAIFMHIARPEYTPTGGCIALSKEDLLDLLAQIEPTTMIDIQENS